MNTCLERAPQLRQRVILVVFLHFRHLSVNSGIVGPSHSARPSDCRYGHLALVRKTDRGMLVTLTTPKTYPTTTNRPTTHQDPPQLSARLSLSRHPPPSPTTATRLRRWSCATLCTHSTTGQGGDQSPIGQVAAQNVADCGTMEADCPRGNGGSPGKAGQEAHVGHTIAIRDGPILKNRHRFIPPVGG